MTEGEWLACTDPKKMLRVLRGKHKASDRKLRLVACGCCRRIWEDLTLKPLRLAIEAAEQYADLSATDQELEAVHQKSVSALARSLHRNVGKGRADTTYATKMRRMGIAANAAYPAPFQIKLLHGLGEDEFLRVFSPVLLRCVVGNPFRPVSINPAWFNPTVSNLATAAYEERIMPSGELDPDRLAVLSDALEEAGCDNTDILNHLRSPGPHVRGCWAVDLLLGKE
jgi:hypothetical protein